MKRINILESQYINNLILLTETSLEDIYTKYYQDIPWQTFNTIIELDPTTVNGRMGKYSKWLLNIYRKGTFKEGDFNEARQLLPIYEKYKNIIQVKDVMSLNSMSELYNVVQPYMSGNKATSKSDATRKVKEGAEKVYEDAEWIIVIPHTEEASKLYGANTRWCTAAENNNMFDYYNNQGTLFINIRKYDGEKFQFHFETDSFMDSEDKSLEEQVPDDNTSVADIINMPWGARKYYFDKLGKKSKEIIMSFNSELFEANKILEKTGDATQAFDKITDAIGLPLSVNNLQPDKPYIVAIRKKENILINNRLTLKNWTKNITFLDNNIISISNGKDWRERLYTVIDIYGVPLLGENEWFETIDLEDWNRKLLRVQKGKKFNFYLKDNSQYRLAYPGFWFDKIDYETLNEEKYLYANGVLNDESCYLSKDGGIIIKREVLQRDFIDYIEKNCLELVYDYESGNQTGKKESPLGEIIPMYEEEKMHCYDGLESNDSARKAMRIAYIRWWAYAEAEIMPEGYYGHE